METIFTINDLGLSSELWENIRVKLGRMVKKGSLKKVGKGRFYRPQNSMFGETHPNQEEIVKDLLVKDGKLIGYLTGYYRWNQMGLTSQISGMIQIATNNPKRNINRGIYSIKFIRQKNEITEDNTKYLILLDAIGDIRKIPDTSIETSAVRLAEIIGNMKESETATIISLALNYPARVRALLGLILENIGRGQLSDRLINTLNPLTTYKYPGLTNVFTNSSKWHIK